MFSDTRCHCTSISICPQEEYRELDENDFYLYDLTVFVIDRVRFVEVFKELARRNNNEVDKNFLFIRLENMGFQKEQMKLMLKDGLTNGIIYERRSGVYAYVDDEEMATDWREELR